jgi:hypothetical protein
MSDSDLTKLSESLDIVLKQSLSEVRGKIWFWPLASHR